MKKWVIAAAVCILTACSSGGEGKTYYQLPVAQSGTQTAARQGGKMLWVEAVRIPDYLAGNGLVYQTSEVQYAIASNNLWASPLDQQLLATLVANLSNQLPGWTVSSTILSNLQYTLSVNITGFHGRYDGRVIVSGEWLLRGEKDGPLKRSFNIEVRQPADGYDAMVKALSEAWSQEAMAIVSELNRLP